MKKIEAIVGTLSRCVLLLVIITGVIGCQSVTGPESAGKKPFQRTRGVAQPTESIEAINIVYSSIRVLREVNGVEEWVYVGNPLKTERTFDLLTVLDGFEAILGGATMEPGSYLKMRVRVRDASITVNGEVSPLKIAGNALRINEVFEVGPSGHAILPLDFNASQAVREKARGKHRYKMRGILRLGEVPQAPQTGTISGVIVPSVYGLVNVYVSGTYDLVASAYSDPDTDEFLLAELPPGTYDLEASAPGYYSGWEMGVVLSAAEVSDGHVLQMTEIVGGEKR